MSESDNLREHELECMRLAADCMQLAGEVHSPALRSHFLRMAGIWRTQAVRGPNAVAQTKNARTSRQQAISAPV
jgi:hypothetical protein